MSKTLMPSVASVTVRDSKGLKFMEVAGAAYNKAGLTEDEAQRVNQAPGLVDLIANHISQHRHEVPPILKLVAKGIEVPAHECFVAKDSFVQGHGFYLWNNFRNNFLDKVEQNVSATTLVVHQLQKDSLDTQIRKELGHEHEETSLAHFFDLLNKQSKGENGHLLVNGYANIAYIRDVNGILWAVNARWGSAYRDWYVDAFSVADPDVWLASNRVVSRDC